MSDVKLTKTDLRQQQIKLTQLKEYLPTLRLKKSLLQVEVNLTKIKIDKLTSEKDNVKEEVLRFGSLLTEKSGIDPLDYVQVDHVIKHYENIAGVEIPIFERVVFPKEEYSLFDTPIWIDTAIEKMKKLVTLKENIFVEEEKKRALQKELNEVSIRVNLFEKVLIPRAESNIKKIKIFLGDQELAAVAQAKVAKTKIL